jgi:hypothetical protein
VGGCGDGVCSEVVSRLSKARLTQRDNKEKRLPSDDTITMVWKKHERMSTTISVSTLEVSR